MVKGLFGHRHDNCSANARQHGSCSCFLSFRFCGAGSLRAGQVPRHWAVLAGPGMGGSHRHRWLPALGVLVRKGHLPPPQILMTASLRATHCKYAWTQGSHSAGSHITEMLCHTVCTTGPTCHHTLIIKRANPAKSGAQTVVHHEYRLWGLTTDRLALSCDSGYKYGPRRETDVKRRVGWSAEQSKGRAVLWDTGVVTHACEEYRASLG